MERHFAEPKACHTWQVEYIINKVMKKWAKEWCRQMGGAIDGMVELLNWGWSFCKWDFFMEVLTKANLEHVIYYKFVYV